MSFITNFLAGNIGYFIATTIESSIKNFDAAGVGKDIAEKTSGWAEGFGRFVTTAIESSIKNFDGNEIGKNSAEKTSAWINSFFGTFDAPQAGSSATASMKSFLDHFDITPIANKIGHLSFHSTVKTETIRDSADI